MSQADRAVVAALDSRLPQWGGPQPVLPGHPNLAQVPGSGWWGEGAPDYEASAGGQVMWGNRMKSVIGAVHGYRDQSSRLAETIETIPPVVTIPYLSFHAPLSFDSIRINVNANRYRTLRDFDLDMTRLFEKARRFYSEGSENYGKVLVLQRLYNALTAPYPLTLPPSGIPDPSPTLFASLPAGPGNARSMHETTQELRAGAAEEEVGFGITTFRVGTKDRAFTDEARHKGMAYKLGDFIHLINPDDAKLPIVGQIFKTFVPTKGCRTHHVTVCWYNRPEQTVHTTDRTFYEREVFKTSHFCDHPVEDIIERISVQFYVKWIRGRPQAPEFYPGWPAYICHSRYNDRAWLTVRIKNWGSCIPDELRQTNFMAVVPYDRQIEPLIVTSPFHRGVRGPGFFAEPRGKPSGEDEEEEEVRRPPVAPPTTLQAAPSHPPEMLPTDTARLFERDSRGQVLWFSAPPLAPGATYPPQQPSHSLEYLEHLTKRKRGEEATRRKLQRGKATNPETEDSAPWWARDMSAGDLAKSLKAVIN